MKKNKAILVFFAFIVTSGSTLTFCDEIYLKNGDKLSGEIVRMEMGVLLFKTNYAKEIKVKWKDIACLTSKKDNTFVLNDKEALIGLALCTEGEKIRISGPRIIETIDISTSEIITINPSPPPSPLTYKANLSAGGSITDGNTNTKSANASGNFEARSKRNRFTLRSKYNYGETDGEISSRNATGSFKYDFFITDKFYTYANSLFEKDNFQDLNLRSIIGVGLGYQFLDTERMRLNAETGISYFNEDYDTSEDKHYASARWSMGFELYIVQDKVKLYHLHEGYYSLEKSNSYYITSELGLRIHIANNFYTNFQVDHSYNSQPAEGREKSNTTYILGITYEYNF